MYDRAKSFVMLSPMQMTVVILSHPKKPNWKKIEKKWSNLICIGLIFRPFTIYVKSFHSSFFSLSRVIYYYFPGSDVATGISGNKVY